MNSKKKLLVSCTVAISMVPFHTNAATGQIGLEAYADALVSKLSTPSTTVTYQLDSANKDLRRKLNTHEIINLYARNPQNSELVSRMDCVVNDKGRVIRLTTLPLDIEETGNKVSKAD